MMRPKDMDDTAAKFWTRHKQRLEAEGLLTEATADSFALLCRVWSMLTNAKPDQEKNGMIKFIALLKQFQSLARGFNMSTDKPRQPDTGAVHDEFGL